MARTFTTTKFITLLFLCKLCCGFKFWGIEFGDDASAKTVMNVCSVSLISDTERSVRCTCNIALNETDCSNLEIGSLPSLISFPNTVKVVNFQGNKLVDIKDDTFFNGKAVVELDLSNNKIDFLSIDSFKAFGALQRLMINHNALWVLQPDVFDPLNRLLHLDLSFNDIRDIQPEVFKRLQMLKNLKLNSNPLHVLDPKLFKHLDELQHLELSSTMLKEIPELIFTSTPNLRSLNLSLNMLNEVPTTALSNLKKLENLNLSWNNFDTLKASSFHGLDTLAVLYMNNLVRLKSVEDFAFGDLRSLIELHCSFNHHLSHVHEEAFIDKDSGTRLQRVEKLFLSENKLETLSFELLSWNKLTNLYLGGNAWNCDCRLQWMMDLDKKDQFRNQILCSMPHHLEGKTLSRIESSELVCGLTMTETIFIGCAAAVAVLLLSLVVGIIMHRRAFIVHTTDNTIYLRMINYENTQIESKYAECHGL